MWENIQEVWRLLEQARERGFGSSLQLHSSVACATWISIYVCDDTIEANNTVFMTTEPISRLPEVVRDLTKALEEYKRPLTVGERAAQAYGVSARELTLGQLEDFKKELFRKGEEE